MTATAGPSAASGELAGPRRAGPAPASAPLELTVSGMTCAACAARIERRLNLLDGVSATVSYATERAYIMQDGGRDAAELITAIEAAGYGAAVPVPDETEPGLTRRAQEIRLRLLVCTPLALPVVLLAMIPSAQFPGWQWWSLLLACPVVGWGAWPLHKAAWNSIQHATATMDTLVSLGISASFLWSVYALLIGGAGAMGMRMPFALSFGPVGQDTLFLDVAAGVTVTVLLGRYLEARAKDSSGAALAALARLGTKTAAVLRDGTERRVAAADLVPGDCFVVRPGEKFATDGVITEGSSAVDASLLTGETAPAEIGPGDEVTGATLNMSGRVVVRATRTGAATTLAQIVALVSQAQASKAGAQRLADRLASVFVPCVIALAVVTFGFWLGAGLPSQDAWGAAFAVLVVACPCALGLATTTALLAGSGRGAELGILVKNVQALESARRIDTVVLDKTGTITTGKMSVRSVTPAAGQDAAELLRLAGAVEDASEHPVGQAIARHAAAAADLPAVTDFASLPGLGVTGTAGGRTVSCGSPELMAERGLEIPGELQKAVMAAEDAACTAVLAGWDGQVRGLFTVADALKPGSAEAVRALRALGVRPVLVTGDNARAGHAVAVQLGLADADVYAGVRPAGKAELVARLQAEGHEVAVVGDGVNDAAALARADLGMAIGTGADVAIGAAGLTLMTGDPRSAADAILLARATLRAIRVNLTWAFGYNLVAIPVAALGFLNPLFAGIAMSGSSLIVVGNSLRLRRFRPRRPHGTPPS